MREKLNGITEFLGQKALFFGAKTRDELKIAGVKTEGGLKFFFGLLKAKKYPIIVSILILTIIANGALMVQRNPLEKKVADLSPTFWTEERYVSAAPLVLEDNLDKVLTRTPLLMAGVKVKFLQDYPPYYQKDQIIFLPAGAGTGIVMGDYILTVYHLVGVFDPNHPFYIYQPAYGIQRAIDSGIIKVVEQGTYLGVPEEYTDYEQYVKYTGPRVGPLEIVWGDIGTDLALIKLPEKIVLPSFPYSIGDSSQLEPGDRIYAAGLPFAGYGDSTSFIGEGIISNLEPPIIIFGKWAPQGKRIVSLFSARIQGGFSGGPVMAVTPQGHLELVGITQGALWFSKINEVLNVIKAKTGIDLAKEFGKTK